MGLRNKTILRAVIFTLMIPGSASVLLSQQKGYKGFILNSPVGDDTAIRLSYYGGGDVIQAPLIFRPAQPGNTRLNTALATMEGWNTYVSFDEMAQLMQALARSNLAWKESKKVKSLEHFKEPDEISDNVRIEVVSPMGTARAKISSTKICEDLKPLNSALTTERGLWEFQSFLVFLNCKIPGFDFLKYRHIG
jgi:hypothetical protein